MSGEGPPAHLPRHLAPPSRRGLHRRRHAPGQLGAAAHLKPIAALALEAEEAAEAAEVSPLARVQRGRAAIALSFTLAALPVLVLDNLPAQARASEDRPVEVQAAPVEESSSTEGEITTTTTEAPTTSTTAAPTTSEAPTTTEAPAPPTTEAEVQALAAPAPAPPPPPPTTTTTRPPAPSAGDPDDPATWEKLAQCESGGNWSLNSGNGYYGGLQFSLGSWRDVGGTGYPHEASKAEQIKRGKILQARYGWGQWPHCSRELGYR